MKRLTLVALLLGSLSAWAEAPAVAAAPKPATESRDWLVDLGAEVWAPVPMVGLRAGVHFGLRDDGVHRFDLQRYLQHSGEVSLDVLGLAYSQLEVVAYPWKHTGVHGRAAVMVAGDYYKLVEIGVRHYLSPGFRLFADATLAMDPSVQRQWGGIAGAISPPIGFIGETQSAQFQAGLATAVAERWLLQASAVSKLQQAVILESGAPVFALLAWVGAELRAEWFLSRQISLGAEAGGGMATMQTATTALGVPKRWRAALRADFSPTPALAFQVRVEASDSDDPGGLRLPLTLVAVSSMISASSSAYARDMPRNPFALPEDLIFNTEKVRDPEAFARTKTR